MTTRIVGMHQLSSVSFLYQLPADLITEILSRAPINELGKCKCVCKSWRSLIGSPQFRQIYRIRDRGLILYWSETGRVLPKTGRRTSELRFLYSLPNPNPNLNLKPPEEKFRPLRELNVGSDSGECRIVNGLIASCVRESPSDVLSIYSICRGEKMMVPEPLPYHHSYSSYHFRFDPVSRRYKILRLIFDPNEELQGIHIITLQPSSLPSEWRKLDFDSVGILNLPGQFLKVLYSTVSFPRNTRYSGDGVVCWVLGEPGVILFDVHQERFRWVKFPADLEVILKDVQHNFVVPRALFKEQRLALSLWVVKDVQQDRRAEEEGDGLEWFTLEDDEGENWSKHLMSFPREIGVGMFNSDSHWVGKIPKDAGSHSDEHHYRNHHYCNHWNRRGPGFCCRLSFLPNSYDHFYFSLDDLLSGRL